MENGNEDVNVKLKDADDIFMEQMNMLHERIKKEELSISEQCECCRVITQMLSTWRRY